MEAKLDPSNFTLAQIQELLREKMLKENPTEQKVTEKCSFVPKRANQVPCTDNSFYHYGELHYCKKHGRTVQAINAKKEQEDLLRQAQLWKEAELHNSVAPKIEETQLKEEVVPKPEEKVVEKVVEEPKPVIPEPSTKVDEVSKITIKKTKSKPKIVKRVIKANKWGRFEDTETGIVFDPDSKSAYGVQNRKTGGIYPLTEKEINICNLYKWKYHVAEESEEVSNNEKSDDDTEEKSSKGYEEDSSESEKSVESPVRPRKVLSSNISSEKESSDETSVEVCEYCKKEIEECVCDENEEISDEEENSDSAE